jgi:hypothetical protein
MKITSFALLPALFALLLVGCKSGNDPAPAPTTADLLARTWVFPGLSVKTDAKTYVIPVSKTGANPGTDATTFNKDGSYTQTSGTPVVTETGKWTLTGKTLVLTDVQKSVTTLTVNSITATDIELGSIIVDLSKGKDLNDKVYTLEEQSVGFVAALALIGLDKSNGGTIDFDKEPKPKTVQLIVTGKAK